MPQQAQDLAAELGFESEEGTLLVSREILQDGRNLCRVGGRPASVSILKTLETLLVNIHGQNDGMQLLDERSHIDYLDAFGGYEDQLAEYYAQYQSLLSLRRQIKQKIERGEQLRQRADFLQYQLAELESADLKPGEYEALNERRMLLANVEKIATGVMEAKLALYGDEDQPGVTELLTGVEARLRGCESWSEEIPRVLRPGRRAAGPFPGAGARYRRFFQLHRLYAGRIGRHRRTAGHHWAADEKIWAG